MPETDLRKLMEWPRYKERGGLKGMGEIYNSELPYETKLLNIQNQYLISRSRATQFYSAYKALVTVK